MSANNRYMAFVWLISVGFIAVFAWRSQVTNEYQNLSREAQQVRTALDRNFTRMGSLSELLGQLPILVEGLQKPDNRDSTVLSEDLKRINSVLQSDVIYLMDASGKTVASSNYDQPARFLGQNFSFRPYFQRAMEGKTNHYHALGTTSQKLGYYFATPVKAQDQILGVLVMKVNIDWIWSLIENGSHEYFLVDDNGIIFFSTETRWSYKSLWAISDEKRERIKQSRQFVDQDLSPITSLKENPEEQWPTTLCLKVAAQCQPYFIESARMDSSGWLLIGLSSRSEVLKPVLVIIAIYSLAFWLLMFVYLYFSSLSKRRKELENMNNKLADRVQFLTKDLRDANSELLEKISQYQAAEEALEATQKDLIQAEKMAVLGEISAGLNHELNQPLLAISAYAENGQKFIARENYEKASENLNEIVTIAKTMGNIIAQFKVFSKKNNHNECVHLEQVINDALVIMYPRIQKDHVVLRQEYIEPAKALIYGSPVQLQQVIINLMANAIQAMEEVSDKLIVLKLVTTEDTVNLSVLDDGPGLSPEDAEQIFSSFYTTKPSGLGLGLTLSKRIVESFGGKIVACSHEEGGTEFKLTFPRYKRQKG